MNIESWYYIGGVIAILLLLWIVGGVIVRIFATFVILAQFAIMYYLIKKYQDGVGLQT